MIRGARVYHVGLERTGTFLAESDSMEGVAIVEFDGECRRVSMSMLEVLK